MRHRVQLVLDTARDADILRWLAAQPNRSAAIRAAIRAAARPASGWDAAGLRRILREELAQAAWPVSGNAAPAPMLGPAAQDVDAEAAARLDALF